MKISVMALSVGTLLASATLAGADCIPNSLPGNQTFCLHKYDKNIILPAQECNTIVDHGYGDHLQFQCTSGKNSGKQWDIYCINNGSTCNVTAFALCTYSVKRMRGAHEWNVGQHCTAG
jgi:hypothetical protein